jgi:hypothetical protein
VIVTDIIFSFDTEDFTSNRAADAIYREAKILEEEGVRGCFCLVGLLADQLVNWGRDDVLEALSHHEINSHTYGHTLHPMINEYTDIEDVNEAMRPSFTTGDTSERCGMGFLVMQSFTDQLTVKSKPGRGTSVLLKKVLG